MPTYNYITLLWALAILPPILQTRLRRSGWILFIRLRFDNSTRTFHTFIKMHCDYNRLLPTFVEHRWENAPFPSYLTPQMKESRALPQVTLLCITKATLLRNQLMSRLEGNYNHAFRSIALFPWRAYFPNNWHYHHWSHSLWSDILRHSHFPQTLSFVARQRLVISVCRALCEALFATCSGSGSSLNYVTHSVFGYILWAYLANAQCTSFYSSRCFQTGRAGGGGAQM